MLQELFSKQRRYLEYFFSHLDVQACEPLLQAILDCKGILCCTGVGKSGFIAQKIAATMLSTGTRALFLSPIDALHGDLGMISKEDLVLTFSKSGETDELVELLPFLRNKGARVAVITSNRESRLARGGDLLVFLPCENELCPFDLAPTTSTEVQLLFGDVLAIALMQARGFALRDYAENHPAGRIGRRSSVRVRDLMTDREKTPLCLPEARLEEVLRDFSEKRCGCLIIVNAKKQLEGILTDGDLRRALQSKGEVILQEKIESLMTVSPKFIQRDAFAWDALRLMQSNQKQPITVLPVVDASEEVVGIIKMHDLIQAGI